MPKADEEGGEYLLYVQRLLAYLQFGEYDDPRFRPTNLFLFALMSIPLVCNLSHLVYGEGLSMHDLLNDVSTMISSVLLFTITVNFFRTKRRMRDVLRRISLFRHRAAPPSLRRLDRRFEVAIRRGMWCLFFPGHVFNISLIYSNGFTFAACPDHVNTKCGLLFNVALPFDVFYTPARQIVCLAQIIGGSVLLSTLVYGTFFIFLMRVLLAHRIEVLRWEIAEVGSVPKGAPRRRYLRTFVQHHQQVIRYNEELNELWSALNAVSVFVISLNISLQCFVFMNSYDSTIIVHMTGYLLFLMVISSTHEHLSENCLALGDAVFQAIPYDDDDDDDDGGGGAQLRKDMMFIIQRCNKPLSISAGKFGDYSRRLVAAIAHSAFSLISLYPHLMNK